MKTNLSKWGNSAAIRIPKTILEELNIDSNNFEKISFSMDIEGDKLILKKKQEKTKFELLAEQSNGEKLNPKVDIDWGNPTGKEEW
ncbi:AbrB/MazE/SpoVT family DNA-binding domain-containing protein [Sedimentibacter sp. MB31-C6]|uniref:AbrB/MazE/SpoVT family DNA-binding domain-containing protein n=1 Tax=Sedimentibacter sp. MB31-C6 TaxID=3109366 RepID=UPI002DDD6186|nr:AbrB/MazE/SpoVT family DNA-binding domain-containing protein [Sedimentibacter sp. MB36-C1]WSI04788.1 AbrB/MazE/SpoVT family DNA-binding domain-containing protein [Sedimentibacter sp. MB36-C1]